MMTATQSAVPDGVFRVGLSILRPRHMIAAHLARA
ncbi:hypothetical protein SAMN05444515_10870 [Ectothiorhodospira marina]|uniref:Uncharacterized protein n=1 Tax=Ectothiorhodospira marina TaxID=1396821 RepID=A0A1H7LWY9_9GAMM|nr:hypothetical protein SAMN05444515_10870 [Ectothiorhodospira marina]